MQVKTIKILLVIFVVLIVIASLPLWISKVPFLSSSFKGKPLGSFNYDAVNGIVIKKGQDQVTLLRDQGTWKVNGKNASAGVVKALLESFKALEFSDVVSKNPANFASYGVDDASGYLVALKEGNNELSMYVGNAAGIQQTFYIRKNGQDSVYVAKGTVPQQVTTTESSWLETPAATPTAIPTAQ
jgi:hypothetical protein